jgi:hypothetical protein
MENKFNSLIPEQIKGKRTDLRHSEMLPTAEAAVKCFARAHKRLLNPSLWHQLTGIFSADFYPTEENTSATLHRLARANDYLKIDIPGPGPTLGEGYDWVRVAQIEYYSHPLIGEECVGMKLVPCEDPTKSSNEVAHFFTDEASSTFVIKRKGSEVTSYYYGRNEISNVHTSSKIDNIRNAIVSSGSLASLSEAQWLALIKGFLQEEIGR